MSENRYPCPCGGTLATSRKRVVQEGVDCGVLEVSECRKCGEEYLPDTSMRVVEQKLKKANLWGVERKEVKFWKTRNSITIRLPSSFVRKTGLGNFSKGYVYREGNEKFAIEY
jgi:hypothetical protein